MSSVFLTLCLCIIAPCSITHPQFCRLAGRVDWLKAQPARYSDVGGGRLADDLPTAQDCWLRIFLMRKGSRICAELTVRRRWYQKGRLRARGEERRRETVLFVYLKELFRFIWGIGVWFSCHSVGYFMACTVEMKRSPFVVLISATQTEANRKAY